MDLNADLGESWYAHRVGKDDALMPLIDSCNIACGMHGGDALTMQKTIDLAIRHGVNMGAHPSYPDRDHFGRRKMNLPTDRLRAIILYQVAALDGMVKASGHKLTHLKAHGALYHRAAFGEDDSVAKLLVEVAKIFGGLAVYGPEGSRLEDISEREGLDFCREGFADRRYQTYNQLVPRKVPGAVIHDVDACSQQVRDLLNGKVVLMDGEEAEVNIQTLCLHGDHQASVDRATAVRAVVNGSRT